MNLSVLLIGNNRAEIDNFHTLENIALYKRVHLLHVTDSLLNLHALGGRCAIRTTGTAGVCKATGALDKMQTV